MTQVPDSPATDIPPSPTFERGPDGLVVGRTYARRADGRIDWVKQIPPEHIVFNSSDTRLAAAIEKEYGAPAKDLVYADVIASGKEVNPRHVLVLLNGFIELFHLRGGSAIPRVAHVTSYPRDAANVTCECTIQWDPNVEEPNGFTSYGTADATMENTGGWGYLAAMAGNRAFVRAVKQGLRIPILAFDEIAKKDMATALPEAGATPTSFVFPDPQNVLQKAAEEEKFTFEQVKKAALARWEKPADYDAEQKIETDPTAWSNYRDIAKRDCLTLIKLLKRKTPAKAKKT